MRNLKSGIAVALCGGTLCTVFLSVPVGATVRPALHREVLKLAVPSSVDASKRYVVSYAIQGFVSKTHFLVEREISTVGGAFATSKSVWKTVDSFTPKGTTATGRLTLKGVKVGPYPTRLVAESPTGAMLDRTKPLVTNSFGTISLETFCANVQNSSTITDASCNGVGGKSIAQVGSQNFVYTIADTPPDAQTGADTILLSGPTTCTSVSLQFAAVSDDQNAEADESATIELVQSSNPPTSVTVNAGSINTLDLPLDGGPFSIEASTNSANPGFESVNVYLMGSLVCSSSTGVPGN